VVPGILLARMQFHFHRSGKRPLMRMASFTVRIELEGNPQEKHYDKLHKAMARKGFTRFIKGRGGVWYRLPHAEYVRQGNLTVQRVRDDAFAAAAYAWPKFQILVTQARSRAWCGLKKAGRLEIATESAT
jgi:hypothetical protein